MVEHAEKLRAVNEELVEEMNCRLRLEAKILAVFNEQGIYAA